MKTFLFALGHPAHYHLFKNIANMLKTDGHKVIFVITPKDILENLMILNNEEYSVLAKKKVNENILSKITKVIFSTKSLCKIVKSQNVDLLIGCLPQIAYCGKVLSIPSIFVGEDDFSITWMQGIITYPFANHILAPSSTNVNPFSFKKIAYLGYNELTYLHPNHFIPNKAIVEKYFSTVKPYFILRFAQLNAYHDLGVNAINTQTAQKLVDILNPYGDIYITSERELEPQFEQYRIKINPLDMHHVMAFASLYIGDSQTMAAEAGVLGTPFVRFNDFVGKIGYLKELEDVYKLGFGIKTSEVSKLYSTIEELLQMANRRKIFQNRRATMLSDKIDCSAFFTWFIENYPESKRILKADPDYQLNFK
ncbi:hypothetical protein AQPE_0369 [Aquipluma nitroreducens]|uniref:DUF354 domain-containing protein n=1 Tax=Aquipluma nitroreducens TaxID=2010828 RepID=A0A5K7S3W3_9BACT|nr:DUF354 domain-containing protein [Aquipluma nitroreducens]BBE16232.1 hypothetical protein AQPE_0369 [Aquipluma nitroreducens]